MNNRSGGGIAPLHNKKKEMKNLTEKFKNRLQERENHKAELAKKYGVEENPKLDKCYSLAWEYGHSAGLHEVEGYFMDLVELIK